MKKKANRLDAIKMIISSKDVSSQEELLQALSKEGFELTQATLSRDLKQLKVAKAANNEFFEALSMLEHERGITAEYLIEKIKAAIIIAVKKNYEVEEDHVKVDIDPAAGRFDVALIQRSEEHTV